MPQDPNLYGQPAPKRQRKEMDLSGSLSFAAQMSSLLHKSASTSTSTSTPASSTSTSARPRPSKTADPLAGVRAKRTNRRNNDGNDDDNATTTTTSSAAAAGRIRLRSPPPSATDEYRAARLNMEEKARRYAAMKRGDLLPGPDGDRAPLVDFDRKWAEKHLHGDDPSAAAAAAATSSSSSSSDDDDDDDDDGNDTELVTYTDEFGRSRRVTRAQAGRMARRERAGLAAAADLAAMSARPAAPAALIRGDAVQADAFRAADEAGMAALAGRRDRSATPPAEAHYDARRELRGRGVGFYAFSAADPDARRREMDALAASRADTERARRARADAAAARRAELDARRRQIRDRRRELGGRRAERLADSFLDGLGAHLAAAEPAADRTDAQRGREEEDDRDDGSHAA